MGKRLVIKETSNTGVSIRYFFDCWALLPANDIDVMYFRDDISWNTSAAFHCGIRHRVQHSLGAKERLYIRRTICKGLQVWKDALRSIKVKHCPGSKKEVLDYLRNRGKPWRLLFR